MASVYDWSSLAQLLLSIMCAYVETWSRIKPRHALGFAFQMTVNQHVGH